MRKKSGNYSGVWCVAFSILTANALKILLFTRFLNLLLQVKVQSEALPGHHPAVPVVAQHGVGLPAARHTVGEEKAVFALQDIAHQGQPHLVEDRALGGVFIKHIWR